MFGGAELLLLLDWVIIPPYVWSRELIGAIAVKARAAFRLEAFDFEDIEIFGQIRSLSTLAGANLQFVGWDSCGNVAWDSVTDPTNASVAVTDPVQRTYAATTTPKSPGVYKWQVRITNAGQQTVPVWGYLTVTDSDAPIPKDLKCSL